MHHIWGHCCIGIQNTKQRESITCGPGGRVPRSQIKLNKVLGNRVQEFWDGEMIKGIKKISNISTNMQLRQKVIGIMTSKCRNGSSESQIS